jgi:hypothetical protein
MKPVEFSCTETIPAAAEVIAEQILDVSNWSQFTGYGPLPGILEAVFDSRTPAIVGSQIRVTNTDGSTHVETIEDWQPGRGLTMRFGEFSPPVSRLATSFEEIWSFEPAADGTRVTRAFRLHAKSIVTRPMLWAISFMLKRAIDHNLKQMRAAAAAASA